MAEYTAIAITTKDGRHLRYGPDERTREGTPEAISYSSTIPGGHDTCTFNLRTRITEELPFGLLDDVRVYGPGNKTLWEGMVQKLPRQSGDDFLVNVQCVGHSALLKWDTGFRPLYIDRDFGRWQEATLVRRAALAGASTPQGKIPVAIANPDGLSWSPPNELLPAFETTEAWYDAKGIGISAIMYRGARTGTFTSFEAPTLYAGPNTDTTTGSVGLTLDDTLRSQTVTGSPAALMIRCSTTAGVTPAAGHLQRYSVMAVYGESGVGTAQAPDGVFCPVAQSTLAHVILNAAPGLTYTTTAGGSIEDNQSFYIPQLAFFESVTAEDVILEINKYFLYEWGVWDNREFFWRATDPDRLTWEARLDQGIHLNLEGDDADTLVNGVIVNYTLPDGTSKTAGPSGSGLTVENVALGDTSTSNPVNAKGATKYARLDVSFPTLDSGAVALGVAYLAQLSLPARKGSIAVTGSIDHPTKGSRPVSEVRAGDWVRLSDHPADVPRRIIQASHDPDARQCQIDVGNDVDKVDAILQRVGVQTSLVSG